MNVPTLYDWRVECQYALSMSKVTVIKRVMNGSDNALILFSFKFGGNI